MYIPPKHVFWTLVELARIAYIGLDKSILVRASKVGWLNPLMDLSA